jgi:hypothetical protein
MPLIRLLLAGWKLLCAVEDIVGLEAEQSILLLTCDEII